MSIITISRATCSKGQVVAERDADKLGFACLSREVLLEAAEQFHVPQTKLTKALHDGPNLIERFSPGKERHLAMIKAALLNRLKDGNIVYHGLAGHFFVQEVPQVLKVRVIADMNDRLAEMMEREQLSESVARQRLEQEDKARQSWSQYFCKVPPSDSELYDLVISLKEISVEECAAMIENTAAMEQFRFSEEARKQMEDLAFAATIKATLIDKYDNAIVTSRSGRVFIKFPDPMPGVEKTKGDIEKRLSTIHGIHDIHYEIKSNTLPRTALHK